MSLEKKKSSSLVISRTDVQKLLDKQIKLLNDLEHDKFMAKKFYQFTRTYRK